MARPAEISPEQIALAFALGSYRFDRYKKKKDDRPRLVAAEHRGGYNRLNARGEDVRP